LQVIRGPCRGHLNAGLPWIPVNYWRFGHSSLSSGSNAAGGCPPAWVCDRAARRPFISYSSSGTTPCIPGGEFARDEHSAFTARSIVSFAINQEVRWGSIEEARATILPISVQKGHCGRLLR
jgi:hypothetical protein